MTEQSFLQDLPNITLSMAQTMSHPDNLLAASLLKLEFVFAVGAQNSSSNQHAENLFDVSNALKFGHTHGRCRNVFIHQHRPFEGASGGILTIWNSTEVEGTLLHEGQYSLSSIHWTLHSPSSKWLITNVMKRKGTNNSGGPVREFNNFIDNLQLVEANILQRKYTWSNHRDIPSLAKLDRCLVSLDWLLKHSLAILKPLSKITLNHCPILLSCKNNQWKRKPFRFENFWASILGFDDLVQNWWAAASSSDDAATNLVLKLRYLRSKMKVWNKERNGNVNTRKHEIMKQISWLDMEEEERNLTPEEIT
ncbi:uncharacterized protein [Elaeis guineensis]|uniref:uncharacterized protein n=1 Tax=Elaeis guineensis var. tenera TaxID=51953 RepID=UPI003C6D4D9A